MSDVKVTKKGQLFAALDIFSDWLEEHGDSGYSEASNGIFQAVTEADGELTPEFCDWFGKFSANEGEGGVEKIVEIPGDALAKWETIQNHLATCRELYDRAMAEEITV